MRELPTFRVLYGLLNSDCCWSTGTPISVQAGEETLEKRHDRTL